MHSRTTIHTGRSCCIILSACRKLFGSLGSPSEVMITATFWPCARRVCACGRIILSTRTNASVRGVVPPGDVVVACCNFMRSPSGVPIAVTMPSGGANSQATPKNWPYWHGLRKWKCVGPRTPCATAASSLIVWASSWNLVDLIDCSLPPGPGTRRDPSIDCMEPLLSTMTKRRGIEGMEFATMCERPSGQPSSLRLCALT